MSERLDRGAETPIYRYYRAHLLTRRRVHELSTLRPSRAVIDTLACWGRVVAAWTACVLWPAGWMVALAIPVVGCSFYGLFIIGHDGMHRRLFNSAKANDRFADFFIFAPIGAITRINRWNHLSHHRLLATERDPDRFKYQCVGKADFLPFVVYFTGLENLVKTLRNVFHLKGPSSRRPQPADVSRPKPKYTMWDIMLLLAWQGALIYGLSRMLGTWAYPVLWCLPGFLFAFLADNLRTFAEHSQPRADRIADHHRLITYVSNPLERLFLAPMNMNYHAAHHLWPSIPYYNLRQADAEMHQMEASGGLEWRRSYLGYLLRYALALPLEECKMQPALNPGA